MARTFRTALLATVVSVAAAAAALLLPATSAGATTKTQTIHLLGDCITGDNHTGTLSVSPGTDVTVANPGWATGTYGGANVFLQNQTTTETVATGGHQTSTDLTHTWTTPVFFATTNSGLGFWVMHEASTDVGSIASRQTVVVTWVLNLDQPTLLAYPPVGSTGDNGPSLGQGDVDSPLTCTITAP